MDPTAPSACLSMADPDGPGMSGYVIVWYLVDGAAPRGIRTAKLNACLLRSTSILVMLVKMKRPAVRVMPRAKRPKKADTAMPAMTQPSTEMLSELSCWVRQ